MCGWGSLSTCPAEAARAWDQLPGENLPPTQKTDYYAYDLLIGMDYGNLRNMRRIFGDDPEDKMHLPLDYTDHPRDIADPWYTDDFDTAWRDILKGCQGLLDTLRG